MLARTLILSPLLSLAACGAHDPIGGEPHVSDVLLVDDEAIRHAQRALWDVTRLLAEPAAVVGIAALMTGAYRAEPGERVAVVISGANTAPGDHG